jgi:hypothetical protein
MMDDETPLDADELMNFADRVERLPPADAKWVDKLFQECLRARMHEAELMSGQIVDGDSENDGHDIEAQFAQVALDAAEWLKTLWNVGYMGAGSFPSQPRSAFPQIELEDVLKSSLFARIREGKRPLPFPPPTRNGLPWHDLVEGGEDTHAVAAELVCDEQGLVIGAIIEACAHWHVVEEIINAHEYVVQHRNKGPFFRLQLNGQASSLHREPPRWSRRICLQERGGFHSYTLEWPKGDGSLQDVSLRAATWERAESEAGYWIATQHPEMYGQVSFERIG